MSYVTARYGGRPGQDEWDAERILRHVFTLGFARQQLPAKEIPVQGQALDDCGQMLPWVTTIAVFIWAQVYSLGFLATLGFLEIQAVLIGIATAVFVPGRSLSTLLNIIVNVFVALLATFLLLVAGAFFLGFGLVVLAEA
jgi:hypothetical protein